METSKAAISRSAVLPLGRSVPVGTKIVSPRSPHVRCFRTRRLREAVHPATTGYRLSDDVEAPHIAGHGVVAEGGLQHSQCL